MDGLTTNGVLVMHPRTGFTQDSKPGVWREISVCGHVFTLRETRSAQQRGKMVSAAATTSLIALGRGGGGGGGGGVWVEAQDGSRAAGLFHSDWPNLSGRTPDPMPSISNVLLTW